MYQWWTMKNRQEMLIIFTCIQLRINNESQLAQLQKTILIPQELLCNHSLVLCKIYHSIQPNMFKSRHRTENMKNHSPCHRTTQPNIVPFPQYLYLILNKSSINSLRKKSEYNFCCVEYFHFCCVEYFHLKKGGLLMRIVIVPCCTFQI